MGPSFQFPGALDRSVFGGFVDRVPVPALRPGQVVVLDNLSVHTSARAQRALEAAGCRVRFLPTHSPDLNPIEPAFAKLTADRRRGEPRPVEAILDATQAAFPAITPADARRFYRDAGYHL